MVRRVFFSFYYEGDNWRAAQVRNHWITKPDRESAGYLDKASWEKLRRRGDVAIKRWINNQLSGTSVTVVLIGPMTYRRRWVRYEIGRTLELGHGLLGIHIYRLRDRNRRVALKGKNPFDRFSRRDSIGRLRYLSEVIKVYDWVTDDGYTNFGKWVAAAARQQGL